MADIVLGDDGIVFDGNTLSEGPLGGAETAFISLAEALAARGNNVRIYNKCARPMDHAGVSWIPIESGLPDAADLYIANRGDKLIPLMPNAHRRVFWIHNPAGYLLKWRYLSKLFRHRPAIVFSGAYHAASCPAWVPAGERVVIPYGIQDLFRGANRPPGIPRRKAIFTSNPLRGLDWLLDVWQEGIFPNVPGAELHVFSGPSTYGAAGDANASRMEKVLARAKSMANAGVTVRAPVPKSALLDELLVARVMLYQGDPGETFCLSIAEAQAAGLPAVVQPVGCVAERIVDGVTGFVAPDDEAFAARAISLLTDDDLWGRMSNGALARQREWGWDDAAAAFEALIR